MASFNYNSNSADAVFYGANEVDGWDVMANSTAMSQTDTASMSYHLKKFRQGQEIVNHINKLVF